LLEVQEKLYKLEEFLTEAMGDNFPFAALKAAKDGLDALHKGAQLRVDQDSLQVTVHFGKEDFTSFEQAYGNLLETLDTVVKREDPRRFKFFGAPPQDTVAGKLAARVQELRRVALPGDEIILADS